MAIRSNAICALMIMCSAANLGVLDVGFSLYLTETFNLPEKTIGLYFSTSAISYAGIGLIIGYITDKRYVYQILFSENNQFYATLDDVRDPLFQNILVGRWVK